MVTKSKQAPKSTLALIIEKLMTNLKQHPEFDKVTLKLLEEIAYNGDLSKTTIVENAMKANRVEEK